MNDKTLFRLSSLLVCMTFVFGLTACNTAELFTKKDSANDVTEPTVPERLEEIKQQERAL